MILKRLLPPLRLLTVFEAVLRSGSVKNAAAELNVSQPAVSQSLKQLEDHIGAVLLDRTARPAELTEAGRILRVATVEGLGRISDAIEEIHSLGVIENDSVTIACSVGFATYWLMPRLASFYDDHPGIAVNVMTTQQGAPRLSAGIDIAIRYGDGRWNDGTVERLFGERVDPVCSPALYARLSEEGATLDRATLLHVNVDDEAWVTWARYMRVHALPVNKTPGRQFTNYVQATQAAIDGQGVMLGWRSITGDLVREGRLVRVNDLPLIPEDAYYLVVSPRVRARRAATLIVSWLKSSADPENIQH